MELLCRSVWMSAVVGIDGNLPREIKEHQQIRQRGLTSTEIFKVRRNSMLDQISSHPDCMRNGSIPLGVPTCADDSCMLSMSMIGLQSSILAAQDDANRKRYEFSLNKTKTMLCNGKKPWKRKQQSQYPSYWMEPTLNMQKQRSTWESRAHKIQRPTPQSKHALNAAIEQHTC